MKSAIASASVLLAIFEITYSLPVDGVTLEKRMYNNPTSSSFPDSFGSWQLSPTSNGYGTPNSYGGQNYNDPSFSGNLGTNNFPGFGNNNFGNNYFPGFGNNNFGANNFPGFNNNQFQTNPFNNQFQNPFGSQFRGQNPFGSQWQNPFGSQSQNNAFSNPFGNQYQTNPTANDYNYPNSFGSNFNSANPTGFPSSGSMFQKSVGDSKHRHSREIEGSSKLESISGKTSNPSKRDVGIHQSKGHTKAMAQKHAA